MELVESKTWTYHGRGATHLVHTRTSHRQMIRYGGSFVCGPKETPKQFPRKPMEAVLRQAAPIRGGSLHGGPEEDTLDIPMRLPPQWVHEQRLPPHRP